MTDHRAIIALGIAAIMAFAGVAVLAVDADAADGEGYKVTYIYNGTEVTKATAADGSWTPGTFADVFGANVSAPADYESAGKWANAANSKAEFADASTYILTSDLTVVPVFKIDDAHAEIVLTYGDVSMTFVTDGTPLTEEDIAEFSEAIGIALKVEEGYVEVVEDTKYMFTPIELSSLVAAQGQTATFEFEISPIFTATFVADGVVIDAEPIIGAIVAPSNVSKDHYTLAGWTIDGETLVDVSKYKAESDVTFIAVFEPVTYDVTFVAEGHEDVVRTAKYGYSIDAPALPEEFKFWGIDGQQVEFPYTVLGTTVIEAVPYTEYTITFVAGDDVVGTAKVVEGNVLAADQIPALPAGYKTWGIEAGAEITADATVQAAPIVMYTVTFDWGNTAYGVKGFTLVEVEEGEVVETPAIPDTLGEVKWNYDGAPVTEDMTIGLVAIVYYKVAFVAGDFSEVVSVKEGTAVPAESIPAVPAGFGAWNYDGSVITADTVITADAVATVYNVTFQIEGKTDVVLKTDNIVIPDPAREGYEFQGWVVKGTSNYVDPLTYTYTEDVTFVAMYKDAVVSEVYTVTFQIEGKAPVTQKTDSLTLPNTDREGYEFQGWVVAGASSYVDPMTYPYEADTTFTAVYKAVAPPAPEEPGFLDTTSGQITAIIAVIVVLFVAALLVAPASPLYYKDVKAKVAEKKAAKEAAKKP